LLPLLAVALLKDKMASSTSACPTGVSTTRSLAAHLKAFIAHQIATAPFTLIGNLFGGGPE
jgi:hypothetical protein